MSDEEEDNERAEGEPLVSGKNRSVREFYQTFRHCHWLNLAHWLNLGAVIRPKYVSWDSQSYLPNGTMYSTLWTALQCTIEKIVASGSRVLDVVIVGNVL